MPGLFILTNSHDIQGTYLDKIRQRKKLGSRRVMDRAGLVRCIFCWPGCRVLKSINTSDRVHIILKSNRKKKQNQAMLLSLITPFFLPNLATHGAVDNRGNKDYSYPLELNPLRLVHSTILCSILLLREVKEAVSSRQQCR